MNLQQTVAAITVLVGIQVSSALYLTPGSYSPCSYSPDGPVKILDCSSRGLTDVPGVDPTMTVSAFYLDGNPITSIGPNAFANLSRTLAFLSVKSSALMDRIESAAFAGLTGLTTLTVQGKDGSQSSMNKVNIGSLLSGLRSLSSLSMSSINVNELPISFAGGTSLTDVSLVRTAIATISPYAFSNASNLRTLDLSSNAFNVAVGNMNWLSSAVGLETAVFANCEITTGYLGQIPSLPKLHKLDLSNNKLDRLESTSLENVKTSLEELLLSNNVISESNTQGLAKLQALKKLTMLSDTQLSAIPPEVKQLQALQYLDLRGTKVAGVEADSFHPSSQLRTLKLDYTNVHSLHAQAFSKLTYLEEFTLSASALSKAVILDTAGIQHPGNWSVILAWVPRLQTLSLSGTGSSIDNTGGLTNSIWSAVQLLPGLRRLTLDYNNITALPDFFLSAFANLTYVSLQGNNIDRVTSAAFYGKGGAQIRLQDNRLSAIDNCTLAMFANLTAVSLAGNPFTCNCAMQWLWQRVKSDSPLNLPSMTCFQPAALSGRTWDTLGLSNFCASGEVAPNNCSVLVPTTVPPTTATFPYLLNITVRKASESSVSIEANVAKLVRQFSGYTVKYWPVSRPEAALNTSLLPVTTGLISVQVGINEMYRFCYVLMNGSNWSVESPANCRDFTLSGLASAAVIAIAVLAAIIGIALVFAAVCLLCKKLRHRQTKGPSAEEDPYTYTYPDEKQIGKQPHGSQGNSQFQPTLRPESKRFSKRSRTNLAGSRPSLATSTTTLATTTRMSTPGFAVQNGARPVSGHSMTQQQQQNPELLSGAGVVQPSRSMHSIADNRSMGGGQYQQQMSRSQDQLSDMPAHHRGARMLPAPPRHAHSQELVLDVSRVPASAADGRSHLHQRNTQNLPPSLPPPRQRLPSSTSAQQQQQQQYQDTEDQGGRDGISDGAYVPMSTAVGYPEAGPGESSTDDFRQAPQSPTYNAYLPDGQMAEAMRYPATAQQLLGTPHVRVSGGVDNSAFQRNDASSGYYEMGLF